MNLSEEFERISNNHRWAIRVRAARATLGPSVIRVFKEGTKEHLISLLSAINVDQLLSIEGQEQFKEWFERELSDLA
jgi:hypothetical protein